MTSKPATDRNAWEAFVTSQSETPFLQSWAWGEFQTAVGRSAIRLVVEDGGVIVGAIGAFSMPHPFGFFSLYAPRGPVLNASLSPVQYQEAMAALLEGLVVSARSSNAVGLRCDPPFAANEAAIQSFRSMKPWKDAPTLQPADSLLINLSVPLDELLGNMHQKTRYNIRLAERHGVEVTVTSDPQEIQQFLPLNKATAQRDQIHVHSDMYYQRMASTLCPKGMLTMFLARYQKKTLAANLVLHEGDTVTYLHGASADTDREHMAPHLLQWHQIRWAKEAGARWYDFWGVAPEGSRLAAKWAGITRFKRGFGGEERHYAGGLELPLRPGWYQLLQLSRKIRR